MTIKNVTTKNVLPKHVTPKNMTPKNLTIKNVTKAEDTVKLIESYPNSLLKESKMITSN